MFRSRSFVLQRTVAPASRQTLASVLSVGGRSDPQQELIVDMPPGAFRANPTLCRKRMQPLRLAGEGVTFQEPTCGKRPVAA